MKSALNTLKGKQAKTYCFPFVVLSKKKHSLVIQIPDLPTNKNYWQNDWPDYLRK